MSKKSYKISKDSDSCDQSEMHLTKVYNNTLSCLAFLQTLRSKISYLIRKGKSRFSLISKGQVGFDIMF